jgi:hypothetical protein
MNKRLLFACVVMLTMATVASAASFWGGLINGSFRINSYSTGSSPDAGSVGTATSGAGGIQSATTSGTIGSGLVVQIQGAAGSQTSDSDSQEQGLVAGQGQIVSNSGIGTATGSQTGGAGQTQTTTTSSGTATQTQYVIGTQSGTVTGTGSGSQGTVVQSSVVQIYQYQSY